jgi:vanillate O-demethylase ferredoxin subunit
MSHAIPPTLQMRVVEARALNPLIKLYRLKGEGDAALPGYTAGAHVRVKVELEGGASDWRHYSLIDFGEFGNAGASAGGASTSTDSPAEYVIAVRREADGRGGSRYMHERLKEGDRLTVEVPKNDFPLHDGAGGAVLVAGGIGVTPLVSMAAQSRRDGRAVRMHYAGRSRELMVFLPELQTILGDALVVHADVEAGAPLDIAALLDGCAASEQLYVCGPKAMLDAVLAQTQARGWTKERVHFELFTTPEVEAGDHPFEVVLAQSGQSFMVPVGKTILDCLIELRLDPMYDCTRGECGVCAVPVIEGEIDHRDYVLTAREKAAGNVIQVCISRAKGARLVLDL